MSFKNIVYSALIVGIVSGVVYGLYQQIAVNPIIYAAETFEVSKSPELLSETSNKTDGHGHDTGHSHDAWGPEDGLQRITST